MIVPYSLVVIVATSLWMGVVLTEESGASENLKTNTRHVRQISNADQMVQNILRWLQGVYSQQSRRIRQGTFKEYLPPANTQKPRPFGHPSGDGVDDEGNFVDSGYPPAGSITPQPPFPIYTTSKVTGYPSATNPPAQETITPERPGFPTAPPPGYTIRTSTISEYPTQTPSYTSGPTTESTGRPSSATEFSGYPTRPSTLPQEFPTQPSYQPPKVTGYPNGPSTVPEESSTQPPHNTVFPGYPSGPSTISQEISTQPPYQPTKITSYPTEKQPSPEITTVVYTTFNAGFTSQRTPETDESTSQPPITIIPEVPTSISKTNFPETTPKIHDVIKISNSQNATMPSDIAQHTTEFTNKGELDVSTRHSEILFTASELSSTISEFTTYLYGTNRGKPTTTDSIFNIGTSKFPNDLPKFTGNTYLPPEKPFTLSEKTVSDSPDVTMKRVIDTELIDITSELPSLQRVTYKNHDVPENTDSTTRSQSIVTTEITATPTEFPYIPSVKPDIPESIEVTSKIPIATGKPEFTSLSLTSEQPTIPQKPDLTTKAPSEIVPELPESTPEVPSVSDTTSEQPENPDIITKIAPVPEFAPQLPGLSVQPSVPQSPELTTKVPTIRTSEITHSTPEFLGFSDTTSKQPSIPQSPNLTTKVPSVIVPEIQEFASEFPSLSVETSEQPRVPKNPELTTKIPLVGTSVIPTYTQKLPGLAVTTSEKAGISERPELITEVPSEVVKEIPDFTPEFPGFSISSSEKPPIHENADSTTKIPPIIARETPQHKPEFPNLVITTEQSNVPKTSTSGYQYLYPEIPFTLPEKTNSEKPDRIPEVPKNNDITKSPPIFVPEIPGYTPEFPGFPDTSSEQPSITQIHDLTTKVTSVIVPEIQGVTSELPDLSVETSEKPGVPENPELTTKVPFAGTTEIPAYTPEFPGLAVATSLKSDISNSPELTTKVTLKGTSEISESIPGFPGFSDTTSKQPSSPQSPDRTTKVPSVIAPDIQGFTTQLSGLSIKTSEQPNVPENPELQQKTTKISLAGTTEIPAYTPELPDLAVTTSVKSGISDNPELTKKVSSEIVPDIPRIHESADSITKIPPIVVPETPEETPGFPDSTTTWEQPNVPESPTSGYQYSNPEIPFTLPERTISEKPDIIFVPEIPEYAPELPSFPDTTSEQPSIPQNPDLTTKGPSEIPESLPGFPGFSYTTSEQPSIPQRSDLTTVVPSVIVPEIPRFTTKLPSLTVQTSDQPEVPDNPDPTKKVAPEISAYTPNFPGLADTTSENADMSDSPELTTKVPSEIVPEVPDFTPEFPGSSVSSSDKPGFHDNADSTTKIPPIVLPEIPDSTSIHDFSDNTSKLPSMSQSPDLTTRVPYVIVPEAPESTPELPGLSVETSEQSRVSENPNLPTKVPLIVTPEISAYTPKFPGLAVTTSEKAGISDRHELTTKVPSEVVPEVHNFTLEFPGSPVSSSDKPDIRESADSTTPGYTPEFPGSVIASQHPKVPERPTLGYVYSTPEISFTDETISQNPDIMADLPSTVVSELPETMPEIPGLPEIQDNPKTTGVKTEIPSSFIPERSDNTPKIPDYYGTTKGSAITEIPYSIQKSQGISNATSEQPDTSVRPETTTKLPPIAISERSHTISEFPGYSLITSEIPNLTTEVPAVVPDFPNVSKQPGVSEIPEFPGTSVVIPEQPSVPEIPNKPDINPKLPSSPIVPSEQPDTPLSPYLTTHLPSDIISNIPGVTTKFPAVVTTEVRTGVSTELPFSTSEFSGFGVVTSKQRPGIETSDLTTRKYPMYTEQHTITMDNGVLYYNPTSATSAEDIAFPTRRISDITTPAGNKLLEIPEETKLPPSITSKTPYEVTSDKPAPDVTIFISTPRPLSPELTNLPNGITQQFPDKSSSTTETVTSSTPEGVTPEIPGAALGFPTRAPPSPGSEEPAYTTRSQPEITPEEGTTSRPTYTSPTTLPTTPETPGGFVPTGPGPEEDLKHPPHIHALDVQCAKDMMTIVIEFNRVFNGVIYSKGFYHMPECRYVSENSGKIKYTFTVNLNMCGTEFVNAFDSEGKSYLENVLVLQNEAGIQEVWDTIRSVRCLWEGNLKEQLSASLMVGMLTQEIVTFSGDTAMAKLDILLGRGPLGQPANGLVKIGEPMTLVVSISGDPGFDVQVKDCRAIDSSGSNSLDLTDDDGCILKPKLFGAFQKTRQTGDSGASIIAYAYFNAFKFPDIMDIMIECNIELCKTDCEMCPNTNQPLEPARRRRRRDVPYNFTLHDGVSMGKHIRVVLAEDLAPAAHYVDEGICLSTQNFLISSCLMISLLTVSCFISVYMWLKTQHMRFKY